ncbi:MAG: DegT/DnrJ/EryC1/StrS family aminotransferase, partial [Spirochaetota bacterium]
EEEAAILDVLRRGAPTCDAACKKFEEDFAAYCGTRYARTVSNGTAALFLALLAAGVGKGSRVVTTPLTWIATAAAAVTLGAEVDFVDIDPVTYNMDPKLLEGKVRNKTVAVLPVHLYGQCCDMDPINSLAEKYGFAVVEDACHAVGATYKGRKAGSLGSLGCFSFHEQKNISTLGEGGMVVMNDPRLYERVSQYRSHCTRVYGKSLKYGSIDESRFPMGKRFWFQDFDDCGYNFRMTDVQAAVGSVQLSKLDRFNGRRIEIASYLGEKLSGIAGLGLPRVMEGNHHVFHLYPVLIQEDAFGMGKEDFVEAMYRKHGIKVGTHYTPIHLSTAFKKRGFQKGQYPVAESTAARLVTLPINPRQSREALDHLVGCIASLAAR